MTAVIALTAQAQLIKEVLPFCVDRYSGQRSFTFVRLPTAVDSAYEHNAQAVLKRDHRWSQQLVSPTRAVVAF
jgi:hypothetical protein